METKTVSFRQGLMHCTRWAKNQNSSNILVAIAGPSCSGKTTFAKQLAVTLKKENLSVGIIQADDYFKDTTDHTLPRMENFPLFDHPDSYCSNELLDHLTDLVMRNKPIEKPDYDIGLNKRKPLKTTFLPEKVIIVEGLFTIFEVNKMREKFDNLIRIYVDANYRLRLDRRVQRDLLMVGDKIKIENVFKNIVEKSYSETGFSQKTEADLLVYN